MKLPPAALTAPSLCPRCDSPAIMTDYCIACTLPLRRCGSCQGVAGPFDRYCGFCGYEIVRGERRLPVWRLWLLAALIPLVAGIAFGVSPYSAGLSRSVGGLVGSSGQPPGASGRPASQARTLALGYTAPAGWAVGDEGQLVVIGKWQPDLAKVTAAQGAVLATPLQSGTMSIARPVLNVPVDPGEPQAVLAFDVAQVLQAPPAGMRVEIARQVAGATLNGRGGAEVVLKVTRPDGSTWYFERAYVRTAGGLVRVDAMVPGADWGAGDEQRVEAVVRSVRG